MSGDKQEVNLHLINYPATDSAEPLERPVLFGVGDRVTVLIEVDTGSGDLAITVGNGPEDDRLNAALAGMFYELGEMFESLIPEEK